MTLDACAPSVSDKLRALKLTRKFESAKVRPRTVDAPTPSVSPFDPAHLAEREATMRDRQIGIETMDQIRARLKLTPAKSS